MNNKKHSNPKNPRIMSPGSCCDCVPALESQLTRLKKENEKLRSDNISNQALFDVTVAENARYREALETITLLRGPSLYVADGIAQSALNTPATGEGGTNE